MITDFLTGLAILAAFITGGEAPQPELTVGAFDDPFLSLQVGTNPTSGDCLQTNGTDSTWDPCPAGGGGGSFPFNATTNYNQVVYATSTPTLWFQSGFFASSTSYLVNLQLTNATATSATTTNFHISSILNFGGDLFDELVGTGLQLSSGDLQTTLGVAIDTTEITNSTIVAADFADADWGDITIASNVASVEDDSHAHTASSISGLGTADISGLDISDDTNLTGGLGLTLTGDDMACDTASGSVFGCLASADWTTFNAKLGSYDAWTHPQAGTSATTSGMIFSAASSTFTGGLSVLKGTTTNATSTSLSVSGQVDFDTLTSALILTGSTGVLAEYAGASCTNQVVTALSALGATTCTTINGNYLDLTANYAWTGAHDFGGGVIEITNGSSPTVDAIGELALDTTANELLIATSTTATAPGVMKMWQPIRFSYAATSTPGVGTTTRSLAPAPAAGYIDEISCHSNSFFRLVIYDASGNRTNDLIASSTVGTVKFTTNNSFTANEPILLDVGTTSAPTANAYLGCTAKYYYTRN